eukprot:CAMPEP_0113683610 /NCGR_PEP_ID=MMETSP0038_2-20120614/13433_1 /TAXON_ID=2898 /ORGANISM="Cryptomonas paramecium" /LENGTH=138 /DNA_ID=CAMNT_0000603047 /DNA_START=35 /DNA_END=447 /DNA_ORIENTATION=- /assembly_acc=CAM_ASM_000170
MAEYGEDGAVDGQGVAYAEGATGYSGNKVYVGNLAWSASWQDLKDHMRGPSQDLNVAHVEILTEASGRSKGCAIIEYSTPEDAARAISELNDVEFQGRQLFVREDREAGKPPGSRPAPFRGGGAGAYGGRGAYNGGRG